MPIIALDKYSSSKLSLLVPKKIKLLIISLVILTAYLSGKIPLTTNINNKDNIVAEASDLKNTASLSTQYTTNTNPYQIKQLEIGQSTAPAPAPSPTSAPIQDNAWGVVKKIADHTYTMQVRPDSVMATPQEILSSLNNYRFQHGSGQLEWNDNLGNFADQRAHSFTQTGSLDAHSGFLDFLNNQDGFKKLGFSNLGENSSYGFTLQAVHLIEWIYAGDEEHDSNQLNSDWHYVGIGVNGSATDLVFAGNKL